MIPLVLVIITGVQISEEHVSLMSHVSRQPRDTSEQCGPHSYACAGTPRCVLSSQVSSLSNLTKSGISPRIEKWQKLMRDKVDCGLSGFEFSIMRVTELQISSF